MTVLSASMTSLTISWELAPNTSVDNYRIVYSSADIQCRSDMSSLFGISAGETKYILTELNEGTEYTITVTAMLAGGETDEDSIIATTMAACERSNVFTQCHQCLHVSPLYDPTF